MSNAEWKMGSYMRDATAVRLPRERRFGATFTNFSAVVRMRAGLCGWGWGLRVAALTASATIGAKTVTAREIPAPLNKGWFYVGETKGKIARPVVLGLISFGPTQIATVAGLGGRTILVSHDRRDVA